MAVVLRCRLHGRILALLQAPHRAACATSSSTRRAASLRTGRLQLADALHDGAHRLIDRRETVMPWRGAIVTNSCAASCCKRFAHRRARDLKAGGERSLVQRAAGRELAGLDLILQAYRGFPRRGRLAGALRRRRDRRRGWDRGGNGVFQWLGKYTTSICLACKAYLRTVENAAAHAALP